MNNKDFEFKGIKCSSCKMKKPFDLFLKKKKVFCKTCLDCRIRHKLYYLKTKAKR